MLYRVSFAERAPITVATLPAELHQVAIDRMTVRLSSWALIRGFAIGGTPFVSVGRAGVRVCLPLQEATAVFGEPGLHIEELSGGPVAVIPDVPLADLPTHIEHFSRQICHRVGLRGPAEYLSGYAGRGVLLLPLIEVPQEPPANLVYPYFNGRLRAQAPANTNGRDVTEPSNSADGTRFFPR